MKYLHKIVCVFVHVCVHVCVCERESGREKEREVACMLHHIHMCKQQDIWSVCACDNVKQRNTLEVQLDRNL